MNQSATAAHEAFHVDASDYSIDDITDFFVPDASDPTTARAFFGKTPPTMVTEDPILEDWVKLLINEATSAKYSEETRPFRIEVGGVAYRAQRGKGIGHNQNVLQFRHLKADVPPLRELRAPSYFAPILTRGYTNGLVLFVGEYGKAKTTLACSTLISRLDRFKALGRCVEDPIEMSIDGPQGQGYCSQERVQNGIADTLESLARGFPAVSSNHLFVGELVDPRTAAQTLLAATNGLVVITTTHGLSIPSALERMCSMASSHLDPRQAQYLLSTSLRVTVHQTLTWDENATGWKRGVIDGDIFYTPPGHHALQAIKQGSFGDLEQTVRKQNDRFRSIAQRGGSISAELDDIEKGKASRVGP